MTPFGHKNSTKRLKVVFHSQSIRKKENVTITEQAFTIYFGDKQTSWNPLAFVEPVRDNPSLLNELRHYVNRQIMPAKNIIALRYIHSTTGYVIKSNEDLAKLNKVQHSGDYLITTLRNTGLIVATADCLPLVVYDPKSNIIGIAHCGAIGSINGIVEI